jgi:hypothetical protein
MSGNICKNRFKLSRQENSPYSLVPSISQNPHRLCAAILLYFQSLQNGVLRAFLEKCKYSRDACRKGKEMICKVVRLIDRDRLVLLHISGHLQEVHIEMIDELLAKETDPVALDLGEVTLVDREVVKFLATLDSRGVELRNCPGFIREWMRKL